MSKNTLILLVALCAAIAGLIVWQKMRSSSSTTPLASQPAANPSAPGAAPSASPASEVAQPKTVRIHTANGVQTASAKAPTTPPTVPAVPTTPSLSRTTIAAANPASLANLTNRIQTIFTNTPEETIPVKPLPVLEKDYASATNRDTRLDIMMDIADVPGADSVKSLTRLFELETDTDLKVDLLDSLLGIEGFKDEKLIMLTMGARQGLPAEVRQSAIDGLIDLDDQRVIPVLNGLLNDPDPEIREGAKDALEMVQSQPAAINLKK